MKKFTVSDVVEAFGLSQPEANGFVKGLIAIGAVEAAGNKPRPAGTKGNPSKLYTWTGVGFLRVRREFENMGLEYETAPAPANDVDGTIPPLDECISGSV